MKSLAALENTNWMAWYDSASGGASGVIQDCKDTRASGVLVKAADGVDRWAQFAQDGPAIKAAGLYLGAWSYDYANLPPEEEAAAITAALPLADYLVIDAEHEYETPEGVARAAALGQALRKLAPDALIGLTTFGAPQDHPQFPYAAFISWCDFILPQVYFADFRLNPAVALDNALGALQRYGKPIIPIGQAYGPSTPAQIQQFYNRAKERSLPGVFWYDLQSSTSAQRQAVTAADEAAQAACITPIAPEYHAGYMAGVKAAAGAVTALERGAGA